MSSVITHDIGGFRLTLRPLERSVTMAGRCRVERWGFGAVAERLRFYRFLVEVSRTGAFYAGDVAAWEMALREVRRLDRRAAA